MFLPGYKIFSTLVTHLHNQDSLPPCSTEESSSLPAPLPPGQSTAFSVHQRRARQASRRKQIASSLRNPLFCFHVSQEEARRPKKEAGDLRLLTHPPNLEQGRLAVGLHAASKPLPSPHLHPQANRPLGLLGGFLKVAEPGDISLISAWP